MGALNGCIGVFLIQKRQSNHSSGKRVRAKQQAIKNRQSSTERKSYRLCSGFAAKKSTSPPSKIKPPAGAIFKANCSSKFGRK